MKIVQLKPLTEFGTNSYLVISEKGNAALIDAPGEWEYILKTAETNCCTIKMILLTHGHCDHIGAAARLQKETGCKVYIHEADKKKLTDPVGSLTEYFGLENVESPKNVETFSEGDKITLDELAFEVIHTPGHTSGSVCFVVEDIMFSGDTIFRLSVGRTDMPDGDWKVLSDSLEKLMGLSKNYTIYPGHMEKTSLSYEKLNNPYLYLNGGK